MFSIFVLLIFSWWLAPGNALEFGCLFSVPSGRQNGVASPVTQFQSEFNKQVPVCLSLVSWYILIDFLLVFTDGIVGLRYVIIIS